MQIDRNDFFHRTNNCITSLEHAASQLDQTFLGLGVQPPNADLGSLVRENTSGLGDGAPAVIMPALAIATLTIGVNLLIDSLSGRARRTADDRK